jgi:two-component system, cell cycle sensor histidine kinase and response regulator CckA
MSPSDADQLYRALFDVNNAIKLLIDPAPGAERGRILDANQAAVEFYGWSLDELKTMRITDINTLTPTEVRAEMENARTLRRRYFRFRHRTKAGEIRSVEVHSGPIVLHGRELLFSIIHDVTERDLLEEHLKRSQRLEAIGQLAGGVAHDFNNLLTVVMSAARLARTRVPGEHASVRFLDEIDGAAQRGAELTRQLLAFSRRQVMTPQPIAVDAVVAELVPLLERSLGTSHAIALDAAPTSPVVADPAQLEQVVMNLVLNARDAQAQGGTIEVVVASSAGDPVGEVPPGDWVTIAVRDRGSGMDEAIRARIFEPFFTTKPEGTGMGLASVYGTVRQSGGHVTVVSAPGAGSTFTVYLPAGGTAAPLPRQLTPVPAVAPRTGTILLVDDLAAVRNTVSSLLGDLGHTVLVAGSYDEAILAADDHLATLDIVITDVVMPGRSGVALVRDLLALRPGLGCIVMSGDLRDHLLADLPPHVVRLAKPFSLEALEQAVAGLLR